MSAEGTTNNVSTSEDSESSHASSGAVGDAKSEEDTIGFDQYVQIFSEFLTNKNTETPLTVSVEGDWGTGKSSFLAQLKKELDDRGYKTVEFDPWRHDSQGALWAAFALEFSRELRAEMGPFERLKGYISLMRGRVNPARIPVSSVLKGVFYSGAVLIGLAVGVPLILQGNLFATISSPSPELTEVLLGSSGLAVAVISLFQLGGITRRRLASPIQSQLRDAIEEPEYQSQLSFKSEFHNDINRLVEAYVPDDEAVFVFIDDLDRCSVDKAAELTQALNMMTASNPRVIFTLALDREKVAAGIAANHESMLPYLSDTNGDSNANVDHIEEVSSGKEFGFRYLEKFIQIPFQIPEPNQAEVREFVIDLMPDEAINDQQTTTETDQTEEESPDDSNVDLLKHQHDVTIEIIEMVAPALDNNPRAIKKFVNLFRIRSQLAHQLGLFEFDDEAITQDGLTFHQLGKFITISLRWPHLLPEVDRDPYLLAQLEQFAIAEDPGNAPDEVAKWTNKTELMELLRRSTDGHIKPTDDRSPNPDPCSLQEIPINTLLHISPRVDQPTETIDSDMKEGDKVIIFNIDPSNWDSCIRGPTEEYAEYHDKSRIGEPWHGIRDGSPDPTDNFSPGDLVIVRKTGEGIQGLWRFYESKSVNNQSAVPWDDDEYKKMLYCKSLIREFKPDIEESEFMSRGDYLQIKGPARALSNEYANRYLDAILSDLEENNGWDLDSENKEVVRKILNNMKATESDNE